MSNPLKQELSGHVRIPPRNEGRRYEALLRLSEALSACREPEELTKILAEELREFLEFLGFYIIVYKKNSTEVEWAVLGQEKSLVSAYSGVPVEERPSWRAYATQEPFHIADWNADERIPNASRKGSLPKESKSVPWSSFLSRRRTGAWALWACPGLLEPLTAATTSAFCD